MEDSANSKLCAHRHDVWSVVCTIVIYIVFHSTHTHLIPFYLQTRKAFYTLHAMRSYDATLHSWIDMTMENVIDDMTNVFAMDLPVYGLFTYGFINAAHTRTHTHTYVHTYIHVCTNAYHIHKMELTSGA